MSMRFWLLLLVLVGFTIYTGTVMAADGYIGFLKLAAREPWGGQMLADLTIALLLFVAWMWRDARTNGLPPWPYLVAVLATGSIGALAYLVHREARVGRRQDATGGVPARGLGAR